MGNNRKKIALVTGGSRGIGRAIAVSLSAADIFVALTYNTNERKAKDVVKEITSKGGTAIAVQMKIEDRKSIKRGLDNVRKVFSHTVDILVNNAAISQGKPFLSITDRDLDMIMAVNLRGAFACAQEVLPDMIKKGWGRIINIASTAGEAGNAGQANYSAAKAGLIGFTKALARELAPRNVLVNSVSPGIISGGMSEQLTEDQLAAIRMHVPLRRTGTREDVAAAVLFLCSGMSDYITGQVISVGGGMV